MRVLTHLHRQCWTQRLHACSPRRGKARRSRCASTSLIPWKRSPAQSSPRRGAQWTWIPSFSQTMSKFKVAQSLTKKSGQLTSVWQCPSTCLCWPWSPLCCTPCAPPDPGKSSAAAAASHSSPSWFYQPSLVLYPPSPMEGLSLNDVLWCLAWDEMEKDGLDVFQVMTDTFKMMLHRHSSFSFLI